jgi:hypothetical protein
VISGAQPKGGFIELYGVRLEPMWTSSLELCFREFEMFLTCALFRASQQPPCSLCV